MTNDFWEKAQANTKESTLRYLDMMLSGDLSIAQAYTMLRDPFGYSMNVLEIAGLSNLLVAMDAYAVSTWENQG